MRVRAEHSLAALVLGSAYVFVSGVALAQGPDPVMAPAAPTSAEPTQAIEPGGHLVEPWSDDDGVAKPKRLALGDLGFRGALEYRANALYIRPLDLNGTSDRNLATIEHRLRLDGTVDWQDKIRVTMSADVLDGVLWGDNGKLGTDPEPGPPCRATAGMPSGLPQASQ